jgi:integrase
MSDRSYTPIPGEKGISLRDGKFVVRSPHRPGRPSTFETITAARREQARRKAGVKGASTEPFEDYARLWIKRYQGRQTTFDEDTRAAYADALERVAVPFFRRTPLGKITSQMVERFYVHMRDELNLSRASRRKYAAPLKILFTEAVRDGVLPSNPAWEVRITGLSKSEQAKAAVPQSERRPRALPPEHVEPLMAELEQGKRDLLMALAFTGLRVSEVCGLQIHDFGRDEKGRPILRVERQWKDGKYKRRAKSEAGTRVVVVAPPLASRLLKLLAERGNPAPTDPLLANAFGRPYDDHNVRRALRGASKRIGLPYTVTPHQFRHTVASLLYEQGWTDVQVAAMLGHRDPNFTRRNYLSVIEQGDVGVLGDAYGIGSDE